MSRITESLRRLGGREPSPWPQRPPWPPAWFDDPGAAAEIEWRGRTDSDRALLTSWVRDGYAIAEQLVPHDVIDRMLDDVDSLFVARSPFDGIDFHGLPLPGVTADPVTHRQVLAAPSNDREAARAGSWRVHGLFQHSAAADAIRRHDELVRIASMILAAPCDAHYSINFHKGSQQRLHEDTAVFHLGVPTLIVGAWIACEDVVESAGPLVFYPGSHRRELFAGFHRYPRVNLRTADAATTAAYYQQLEEAAAHQEPRTFLARKGDVLFWHGKLIHGGAPITDPRSTRRSYVLHYIPTGVDVADQIIGPTNW